MKKMICILMIVAILLSCCACGEKNPEQTTPVTEGSATNDQLEKTPEELYGHIDQTVPQDGVYKIWSIQGVEQLAKHPEAKFEVLCHIDLEGATLAPIPEFTGEIVGGAWTIQNFTVAGDGENFGLIGINKGNITNINFENVTFQPGSNAKNIGTLAGINEGNFTRCTVAGTMTVDGRQGSCGSLAGTNSGTIANVASDVELTISGAGALLVGGIAGTAKGGKIEYVDVEGALTVTGENKTVGLFAGEATDTVFTSCVFIGADNSLNGQLFTNFTGNAEDDELVVAENALWRDNAYHAPLPENIAKLRQKVADEMEGLVTITWKPKQDVPHTCHCTGGVCSGVFSDRYTYIGVPYNHGSSSLRRAQYVIDEEGYLKDWTYDLPPYDGLQCYLGGDCSAILQQAWWTVSNSTSVNITKYMYPVCGNGTIPVGSYKCDFELKNITVGGVKTQYTQQYIDANTPEIMYESYAAMRIGDAIVNHSVAGGHTRMVAEDPVIVKDQTGAINPDHSYVLMHEQGGGYNLYDDTMTVTHGAAFKKFTFSNLYVDWYIPITCKELLTGEQDPVEATLEGACDGYAGMLTGTVRTNYNLDFVNLTIQDSEGNVVLDHPQFASVHKRNDYGSGSYIGRYMITWLDMADFSGVLNEMTFQSGESYTYTVTACMNTYDDVVVHEGSFTIG